MSKYSEFFLNSKATIIQFDTIVISHPSFATFYIVRNAYKGLVAALEDDTQATFLFYPLKITPTGSSDDLDQTLSIQLGDLGELLPAVFDAVAAAKTFGIYPLLEYRIYRSDDLTSPMEGPFTFEVQSVAFNYQGATLSCGAPKVNQTSTGETYLTSRFPMLLGFQT